MTYLLTATVFSWSLVTRGVLCTLMKHPEGCTLAALAGRYALSILSPEAVMRHAIRHSLGILIQAGVVERVERGWYACVRDLTWDEDLIERYQSCPRRDAERVATAFQGWAARSGISH